MARVVYGMLASLDGFIEDRQGSIEWTMPDEELHRHFNELELETGAHLYGRRLFEEMQGFWPTADQDPGAPEFVKEYARAWRMVPNVVFSRTLASVDANSRLVREDIAEEVGKLKAQPGKDLNVGGAGIASTFMKFGLIDEYRVYAHPILLGAGKPMFAGVEQPLNLRLMEATRFGSGVTLLRYEPA